MVPFSGVAPATAFMRFTRLLHNRPRLSPEQVNQFRAAKSARSKRNIASIALYTGSAIIWAGALTYAAVPFYQALCSRTGFGGTPLTDAKKFSKDRMVPVEGRRRIHIKFSSEVSSQMPWSFKPMQKEVSVLPGETALAFYKAKNNSNEPIIGMATYTVVPDRSAAYFSKIQCFCFEEQLLQPGEEVEMPVFFFIDPDYARDPALAYNNDIVLHYTFFRGQYDSVEEAKRRAAELSGIAPASRS